MDCCQFALSKGKGRVHGFKIDNVFYVYWLDPNHNMYDVEGYEPHTAYKHKPLPDCLEQMNFRNLQLMEENRSLQKENKELWIMLDKKDRTEAVNQ